MELRAKGFSCFVIDLSECGLMDSTFLGVLAGFGLKMREDGDAAATGSVTLLNPNSRVTELLENLGVLQLFRITHGELAAPETLETCASEPAHASREELTRAKLLWDASNLKVTNLEDASQFVRREYREGWSL